MSDALVIPNSFIKTVFVKEEYRIQIPFFELLQHSEYHVKIAAGIIFDSFNNHSYNSVINPLVDFVMDRTVFKRQLRDSSLQLESASKLEFYTDGSLFNQNTLDSSMSFGLIQTHPSSPQVNLSATIDNWPLSLHSELAAVLSALMISPKQCDVTIFTDSESIIKHYNECGFNFIPSSRFILKEENKFLWTALRETIIYNELQVTFVKVPSHSNNLYNDMADKLAKSARYSSNVLSLDVSNFTTLQVIPVWKKIQISTHLRHFISDLSRNTGFERWFNLHRNTKYRKLEVDWHSTFQALDNDEPRSSTSFLASSKKKSRVKYLIEELPTIEHMKKRRPDLYNNWLCPNCESQQETFSHVWLCPSVSHVMNQIIIASKQDIVRLITEKVTALHPGRVSSLPSTILDQHSVWSLIYSADEFTFLDLIKGFVPKEFSLAVGVFLTNPNDLKSLIVTFLDNLHVRIRDQIWSPRCELIIDKEKTLNITSRQKKRKNSSSIRNNSNTVLISSDSTLATNNLGFIDFIQTGRNWLDFIRNVSHCFLSNLVCFIVTLKIYFFSVTFLFFF